MLTPEILEAGNPEAAQGSRHAQHSRLCKSPGPRGEGALMQGAWGT